MLDISKSSIYYNLNSFRENSIESISSFMKDKELESALELLEISTSFERFNIKEINRTIADYFLNKMSYNLFNNF